MVDLRLSLSSIAPFLPHQTVTAALLIDRARRARENKRRYIMVGYAMAGTVLCLLLVMSSTVAAAAGARPPAIFVFGDSTRAPANMPHYGIDFPGSVATGRFSNGYNIADFLAKNMGFSASPPTYLSLAAVAGGVSYASGGAGILDSTNAGKQHPLSKQAQYFRSTRSQMVTKLGSPRNEPPARQVRLPLQRRSNDMRSNRTSQPPDQQRDVATLYANLLSGYPPPSMSSTLLARGARHHQRRAVRCSGELNQLASGFDGALASTLAGLASTLRSPASGGGFAYSLADYYGFSAATFEDPAASGYTDVEDACCGGGRLGAEVGCGMPNATVCGDRDRHATFTIAAPDDTPRPSTFKELAQTGL
ncbi:hypothetical protein HU200_064807 [Digitaria exilis]|uniref:GDSL esterase/lipase n=1 Tax=Digitaria exilis TaxID=1010633 RepID=A0A835DVT7_9POAL|nr:hypothetical protein HU200_064807 [Digitaria exilis]